MRLRERIPAISQWLAAALIVLWLFPIVSLRPGCFSAWTGSALSALQVASDNDAASHAVVCHCLNCPGGKMCCCLHAHSGAERLAIRSFCDRETPANPPMALPDSILPTGVAVRFVAARAIPVLWISVPDRSLPVRSSRPDSPPPRFS